MAVSVKQYSLLDYTLAITLKSATTVADGLEQVTSNDVTKYNIPIGGAGRYLGSIKFTKSTDNISKIVDATGMGVFAFTNDHSGQVDIEISQVSDQIKTIINQLASKYHSDAWKDTLVDIVMSKAGSGEVIEATDCMLVRMPDLVVADQPERRTFSFLAMEIREKENFTY